MAKGRKASSLEPFLRRLKPVGASIEAIAMDMQSAYITAVLNQYPSKVVVFDRYHIISEYNRVLDELRRQEVAATPTSHEYLSRGVRYLLLKESERIEDGTVARAKLDWLWELNTNLSIAYILKEELRQLWSYVSRQEAEYYLYNWLQKAWSSGIRLLKKFADKLTAHRTGILNYFDHHITTGKVETINNKIKVLKRRANGYRNMEYFTLRICFLHESGYALVG